MDWLPFTLSLSLPGRVFRIGHHSSHISSPCRQVYLSRSSVKVLPGALNDYDFFYHRQRPLPFLVHVLILRQFPGRIFPAFERQTIDLIDNVIVSGEVAEDTKGFVLAFL